MNVLKDADVEAAPAPDVRTETTGETSSLFRRLRARLGL